MLHFATLFHPFLFLLSLFHFTTSFPVWNSMFYHSQDHKGIELGRDLRKSLVQPSAQGKVDWDQTKLLRALSSWVLKPSKDEDCTSWEYFSAWLSSGWKGFSLSLYNLSFNLLSLILPILTAARVLLSNLLREIISSPGYTGFATTVLILLTFLSTVSSSLWGLQKSSIKIGILHPFPLPPFALKFNSKI